MENLIAGLLNEHLGQFVELVDPAQLNLSVLSGKVLLQNLKVKPSALEFLQLPVRLKYGSVGKIALNANWKSLGSQPVQVSIEEVLIVAEPRVDVAIDSTAELARLIQAKLTHLKDAESMRLHAEQDEGEGHGSSLQEKIVDNVQVNISKIHFRYEDYTVPSRPVSLGMVLHDLNAQTTDEGWLARFVVGARSCFKLVKLDTFFVYCCVDPKSPFCGPQTPKDLTKVFAQGAETELKSLGLLLAPLSGALRLVLNKDHSKAPHISVAAELDPIVLALSKEQYQRALDMVSSLSIAQATLQKYLNAITSTFREPSEQEARRYCDLYKRTLNASWLPELSDKEQAEKETMEKEYVEEALAKARYTAFLELKKQLKKKPVKLRQKHSKLHSLFGSSSKPAAALSEEQLKQIDLQLEAFDPTQPVAHNRPVDFIEMLLNFRVASVTIALTDGETPLHELSLRNLSVSLTQYPRNASAMTVEVASVQLSDAVTPRTLYPHPIESAPSESKTPFVCFKYEKSPLDDSVDQKVSLKVQRVQVVLHQQLIQSAMSFFTPSAPVDMHVLAAQWSVAVKDIMATELLSDVLRMHTSTSISVQVAAPIVVFPMDPSSAASEVLVADLGLFKLETIVQNRQDMVTVTEKIAHLEKQDEEMVLSTEDKAKLYDRYQLTVEAIQLYLTNEYVSWKPSKPAHHHLLTLSEKVATLEIGKCISASELRLANLEIKGELPELRLHLSIMDTVQLLAMANTFEQAFAKTDTLFITELPEDTENKRPILGLDEVLAEAKDETWGFEGLVKLLGSKYLAQRLLTEADIDGNGSVDTTELRNWWTKYKEKSKQDRLLTCNFRIQQVTLELSDDTAPGVVVSVLKTTASSLGLQMERRPYATDVKLDLSSLLVVDTKTKLEPHLCKLVETSSANGAASFVSATMSLVDDNSPEWANLKASCNVRIGGLSVQLHPETVQTVGSFALLKFLPIAFGHANHRAQSPRLESDVQGEVSEVKSEAKKAVSPLVVHTRNKSSDTRGKREGRVNFALTLAFDLLLVKLAGKAIPLAELQLQGLSAKMKQYPNAMHVELGLSLVELRDVTGPGDTKRLIVSRTLSSKETALIEVKYDTYSQLDADYPGYENAVEVKFQGLQVVVLNRFVEEMLKYATTGPIANLQRMLEVEKEVQKLADKAAQIANEASAQVVAQVQSMRVLVKLDIHDIALRVPASSFDEDCVQAMLTEVHLSNVDKTDENNSEHLQVFTVDVGALSVTTETKTGGSSAMCVLEPSKTVIDLRPVSNQISVDVQATGLEGRVSHDQLVVLMEIVRGNLAEKANTLALYPAEDDVAGANETRLATASQKEVGEPEPEPESKLEKTIVFKLGLPEAKLRLYEGSGKEEDSLIEAKVVKFAVDVSVTPGEGGATTVVTVGCAALKLVDASIQAEKQLEAGYREILTFDGDEKEVTILKLKQTPTLRTVDVGLSNFKFQVAAVLFALPAFADVGTLPITTPTTPALPAPKPSTDSVKTVVRASLGGRMHLIEDPSLPQTQHLILEVGSKLYAEIDNDGAKVEAQLTGVQVFQQSMELVQEAHVCKFGKVKNAHVYHLLPGQKSALPPCVTAKIRQVAGGLGEGPRTLVEVVADPLNATFTLTSYVTLLNCVKRLQESMTPRQKNGSSAVEPAPKAVVSSFGEQAIAMQVRGLSLTLVNDMMGYELPLARLNMDEITLKVSSFSHQRDFMLSSHLFVSSFNNGWEPLVEPWHFSVKGSQTATSLIPHDSLRLVVSAPSPLELNFTYAMGLNVLESIDLLSAKQLEKKSDAHSFKPHLIHNYTEFELTFRPFRHTLDSLQDLNYTQTLKPFQSLALDLDPEVMTGAATYSLQIDLLLPSAEAPGDEVPQVVHDALNKAYPTVVVPLQKVGSTLHPLKRNVCLVCTVTLAKGTRVISLHSPLGVVNKTETPLLISPELDGRIVTLRSDVVEPGQTCWMPVRAQEVMLELSLRPTNIEYALSYSMSKPMILAHPSPSNSPLRFACQSDAVGSFGFIVTSRNVKNTHTVYEVCPPLIVHNCLPYGINVRVAVKEDPNAGNVSVVAPRATEENPKPMLDIPMARHLMVHASENIQESFLSLALQDEKEGSRKGGGFSDFTPLKLREASTANTWSPVVTQVSTPTWQPFSGTPARVNVNIEQRYERGVLVVSLYVPFWFFDITQLSLAVTENKRDFSSINFIKGPPARQPMLFNPSHKVHHVYLVAEGGHTASESISLNSVGAASALNIPLGSSEKAETTLEIAQLQGKFQRTKTVTIAPRYVLVNNTKTPLLIRPCSQTEEEAFRLAPRERISYYGAKAASSHAHHQMISFRRVAEKEEDKTEDPYREWRWSGKVVIDVVGTTHLQVPHSNKTENWYPYVDICFKNSVTYVLLEENPVEELDWRLPFRVDNECLRQPIQFRQKGSNNWVQLQPLTKKSFAWEEPGQSQLVQVEMDKPGNSFLQTHEFPVNEVKNLARIELTGTTATQRKLNIFAFVKADGPVLVLTFSDIPPRESEVGSEGKNDQEEQAMLQGLLKGFSDDLERLLRMQAEQHQRTLKPEEAIERPKYLASNADELQVAILTGSVTNARNAYVKVIVNGTTHKTKTTNQQWNEMLRFTLDPTDIQLNTMISISVWEENSIMSDAIIAGNVYVPLMSLDSHRPATQEITFKQGGSVRVKMWWVGTDGDHRASDLVKERINENNRIIHILEERLHERAEREGGLEKYRYEPTSEFTIVVKDAISVSNLKGVNFSEGSLKCVVDVPVIKHKSSLLICERALALEQKSSDSVTPREKKLVGHSSSEVPASVRYGDALRTRGILAHLAKRVLLEKEEKVMYHVCNSSSFVEDETMSSVLVTNRRVIAIEHGPPQQIPLASIIHVDHVRFGQFRWDQLRIWDTNLKEHTVGIYSENAASFFEKVISESISPANQALFARAQKGTQRHEDPLVGDTIRGWSQKVKLFIPDSLLEKDDLVRLSLWYTPEIGSCQQVAHAAIRLRNVPFVNRVIEGKRASVEDVEVKFTVSSKEESSAPALVLNVKRHKAYAWADRWTQRIEAKFPWIGLSLINDVPEEILYLSLKDIHAIGEVAPEQQTLMFRLGRAQIDNQNPEAIYPVILAPTPMPKALEQPLLQVSLNKSTKIKRDIHVFTYASFLLQKIDVQVEEELIYTLLNFINELVEKSELDKRQQFVPGGYEKSVIAKNSTSLTAVEPPTKRVDLFFTYLHLQPIAANISFQVKPGLRRSENYLLNPFSFLLSLVGTTIASIEQAPFRISGLVLENVRTTVEGLSETLVHHFKRKALGQIYTIFGSLEILGNPIALVDNLGTGVKDFFYEPAKGLVTSPAAFGTGLAQGSLSLLKSTFSVFEAAGKITSSISKGISQLSMDEEFIQQQRRHDHDRPEHVGEGLVSGAKSLGKGLFGGITGLVTEPVKGAKQDGALGFMKGVGKGVVGLVAKPAAGAVDMTSQTLKGIGNTASYVLDDKVTNKPVRPRRVMDGDRVTAYDAEAALAQQRVDKKKESTESFIHQQLSTEPSKNRNVFQPMS